jgi:hypothetical protein
MRRLIDAIANRLPLQFRVLHRQFLLRVVDLEAMSIEADIPRFLGQFAGILIMISLMRGLGALVFPPPPSRVWQVEQGQISNMLLVIGLCAVITWEATFPDRRDLAVLGPLPVRPRTILLAKLSATCGLLGIAIVSLNFASSCSWALVFGGPAGYAGIARFFLAFWFTIVASAAFLYGAVLTLQGFTALLLPRKAFLRVSAALQLGAFAGFLGVYFLQPSLGPGEIANSANRVGLASSPTFWFFGLLNQLNGSLPPELSWLALRAWIALGLAIAGALASLLLCYLKTMKKTAEQPDLVPGAGGLHWTPRFGGALHTSIVTFCLRSLSRSRQHRVVLAFYLSLVFAIALSWLRHQITAPAPEPVSTDFLISTFLMMTLGVFGLRGVFSLPISLQANWVLRITQLQPTRRYFAATRLALLLFGVAPILLVTTLLSLNYRPWQHVMEHLAILALLGLLLTEFGLYKFDKVPFTCSFLPGKTNIQVIFCGFAFLAAIFGVTGAVYEQGALHTASKYATMAAVLLGGAIALGIINRIRAKDAQLYFEEVPIEVITRLGLLYVPPARSPQTESPTGDSQRAQSEVEAITKLR